MLIKEQASSINWRDEARSALLLARSLLPGTKLPAAVGSRRPCCVAVLFAISQRRSRTSRGACLDDKDLTPQMVESVSAVVTAKFSAALTLVAGEEQFRDVASLPEIRAFCVAVTHETEAHGPPAGFLTLESCVQEATVWALQHGARPLGIPPLSELKLPTRFMGHWARIGLAAGPVFPLDLAHMRATFENAVDACAMDLQRLLETLPLEPPEWAGAESNLREEVELARSRLWQLRPPFEDWLQFPSTRTLSEAVLHYLEGNVGCFYFSCPTWWTSSAPPWDTAALKTVVHTEPIVLKRLPMSVDAGPRAKRVLGPPQWSPTPSVVRSTGAGPEAASRPSSTSMPTLSIVERRKQLEQEALSAESKQEGPALKKQRRSSAASTVMDLLRRDAEWTEGLLRGVALLAMKTPLQRA